MTYGTQAGRLPAYRAMHSETSGIHSQVLQNVLIRLDRAFVNFFEGRARYPRFKKHGRYRSITYPQIKPDDLDKHSITLSKIGRIRVAKHRPLKGRAKTATVIMQPCGKWYVTITAETARIIKQRITAAKQPVGADSGLTNYLYLSDGEHVDNPRFIKQHEQRIKKAQHTMSRKRKVIKTIATQTGEVIETKAVSRNYLKAKRALANRWRDYTHAKDNWQWHLARRLVRTYDFIAYEDLQVRNMIKNHNLARSIQDASWGGFWGKVENLAAQTDSVFTWRVNPQYTTQKCSRCGHRNRIALSERTYRCNNCGYTAPRDFNSSKVIDAIARTESGLGHAQPVGMDDPELTPAETRTSAPQPMLAVVKSPVEETGSKGSRCADRALTGRQAYEEAHDFSRGRTSQSPP